MRSVQQVSCRLVRVWSVQQVLCRLYSQAVWTALAGQLSCLLSLFAVEHVALFLPGWCIVLCCSKASQGLKRQCMPFPLILCAHSYTQCVLALTG